MVTQQLRNGLCVMFERLKMQEYTKYKRDDRLERRLEGMLADDAGDQQGRNQITGNKKPRV